MPLNGRIIKNPTLIRDKLSPFACSLDVLKISMFPTESKNKNVNSHFRKNNGIFETASKLKIGFNKTLLRHNKLGR